jgi:hypothetical protein
MMAHDKRYSRLKSGSILKRRRAKFQLEPRYEQILEVREELESIKNTNDAISSMEKFMPFGMAVISLVLVIGLLYLISLDLPTGIPWKNSPN